jgi:hypothetical protein
VTGLKRLCDFYVTVVTFVSETVTDTLDGVILRRAVCVRSQCFVITPSGDTKDTLDRMRFISGGHFVITLPSVALKM